MFTKGVWFITHHPLGEPLIRSDIQPAQQTSIACCKLEADASRIVQCVNGWDALKQSHDELVVALQGLLERFVGANQIAKQPPSDFADYVRNLITKAKEVTK